MATHQVSQTYNVFFNSSHRWFYLSGHQPHELLLFKAYDSKTKPGTARGNRRCTLSHEKALLMIYSALMWHLIIHLLLQIVAVERAFNALAWFYILKGGIEEEYEVCVFFLTRLPDVLKITTCYLQKRQVLLRRRSVQFSI